MILNSRNLLRVSFDFSYYECCIHGLLGKDKDDQHLKGY